MRHNGDRSPDEILAEIERTRSELDSTLSAIEHRLTPGQLVDQGLDYLRHSGANEFVRNLGGSVKHNPMPVSLVGIGLAWLMAAGRNSGASQSWSSGESAAGKMSEVAGSAKEKVSRAGESISQTAQAARERLSQASSGARQQYERVRGGYDSIVREQPLALGAIGIAIGAALAAALPRTRKEDELMGEASEQLTEKAKEAGKEQLGKTQDVAKKAAGAIAQGS
ncbi:MAG TPA: DUF3618 domain-containing protein, partial [Burkholderiales bacterium]|nr:DUF3618 domain-containing protein [Burkholderiales bacterium]